MNKIYIKQLGNKCKKFFSEQSLNEMGKSLMLASRCRQITPYRLGMAFISVLSQHEVKTIADLHRGFNHLFNLNIAYKPFHNQLRKKQFPIFMRHMLEHLLNEFACQSLAFDKGSPFKTFKKILLQDGTSFAVNPKLKDKLPGRFTHYNPAAVELHVALDLYSETPENIVLTPDTNAEAQYLPEPEQLEDTLIMGDRGYFQKDYIHRVMQQQSVYCIIKATSAINPVVKKVLINDGHLKKFADKKLKDIKEKLSKTEVIDMDIEWQETDRTVNCRMIVSWNPVANYFQYLTTNLPRDTFSPEHIIEAYRLRWQIELMFKEWKSYANLRTFVTEKRIRPHAAANHRVTKSISYNFVIQEEAIVEALIWGSLCAAILKRFIAHVAQKATSIAISTHKVAKCACYFMGDLMNSIIHDPHKISSSLEKAILYLKNNARRDSLKRDKKTGRSKMGLNLGCLN